jgi:hypothetical protein
MNLKALAALILCAMPSWAAWNLVQQNATFAINMTSVSLSFMSTPTVGNVIVVGVGVANFGDGRFPFLADNQAGGGNVYSGLISYTCTPLSGACINGSNAATFFCSVVAVSSGTFTITSTTYNNNYPNLFIREYSGGSCNPDKISAASGSTSPYGCGSITTANANDLLVTQMTMNSGVDITFTQPAGFGNLQQQSSATGQPGAMADEIVSSTGTFSPTWTTSANGSPGVCTLAALQQAGGGGGGGEVSGVFP